MSLFKRIAAVVVLGLLQACGGGGGGGTTPPVTESSSSSVAASSVASSAASLTPSSSASSSKSSVAMAVPLPTGTADSLPVINLNTDSGLPITSKEVYVKGSYSLTSTGLATQQGTLEIRGRGNSTWDWPKKPYRLKLTNTAPLLGMPTSKNWVLLANYADKTLMRNDLAFTFSQLIGMEYTVRNQYVDVNLNGTYQGVYQLVENIRIDKDRVNIPELKVGDTSADKISGGYLLEIDFRHNKDYCIGNFWESFCVNNVNTSRDVDFCIDSLHDMQPACLQNPDTLLDSAWSAQRQYIQKYYTDMEAALFGSNFKDPAAGYAAYLDVDSVINYYIVNEFFKNVDGAVASFYLYKKRDGKLYFGPIWDFDLALGNAGYNGVNLTNGWHIRPYPWFTRLFEDPAFEAKVKVRWQQLKAEGKFEYLFTYAQARATWLDKMQQKNFGIWSVTDFAGWINHVALGSYDAEYKEMVRWQRERYNWMDSQLGQ